MIWIMCALISAALIVLGIMAGLNKQGGPFQTVRVLMFFAAATYAAYMPAFFATYDFVSALVGNFVHILRVVTVDADIMEFYDVICEGANSVLLAKVYMVILAVLHTILPLASAFTAITILLQCLSSVRLLVANGSSRPIFVFSEMNERSLLLARSLEKVKCDIVFANSSRERADEIDRNKRRYIFKEEHISELQLRSTRRKEIHLFCISENEDQSLAYALQLIAKFSEREETHQEHIHIYQFSKHDDFSAFIDSADKGGLDVRCVNEYEMLIYDLLDEYPLARTSGQNIHVLLYGATPINIVALKAVAWCGQLADCTLKISMVGVQIADAVDTLKLKAPALFSGHHDLRFYDCRNEKEAMTVIGEKCMDANYIIVDAETDNATAERAISLRRLFYKMDTKFANCPAIFCHITERAKGNVVQRLATAEANPKRKMSYHLIPFGNLQGIYSYERLVNSDLEKLAKNVHLAYEEIFSDGDIDVKQALKQYNTFEVNKRSNRANALHIRYKLNSLGLDYTDDPSEKSIDLRQYFAERDIDVEKLAISEHNRWMSFLMTEGWEQAQKEDVYSYRESGVSKGRHNCPALKMHPYICEYEKLKELSIDLEGKDTTVYDKELILRIPDILGDKWNVAGKQYKIINIR